MEDESLVANGTGLKPAMKNKSNGKKGDQIQKNQYKKQIQKFQIQKYQIPQKMKINKNWSLEDPDF